ncbi:MAG: hypothetical protein AAB431_01290 [Patescibacteria group bacterium]
MFSFFAIPLASQTSTITTASPAINAFFSQPIDVILSYFLVWFGWIPIVMTIIWGVVQMWVNYRQGKYSTTLKFIVLAVDVPSLTEQTPKALENLFSNLYGAKSTLTWKEQWIIGKYQPSFSFEIISSEGYIQFLIRTQTRFRDMIEAGIYAHYPDAEIAEVEDYTQYFPTEFPDAEYEMWGGEFTLDKPDMFPIRTYVDFEDKLTGEIKDPLGNTLEQMAKMRPGEHFWFQMLVQPSSNDWVKPGIKRLNEAAGKAEKVKKSMLLSGVEAALSWPIGIVAQATTLDLSGLFGGKTEADKPERVFLPFQESKEIEAIYNKITKVGLGCKIRILYVAKKNVYVKVERTGIVKGILNQYAHLTLNKFTLFIPQVPKDDYFWMRWEYTTKQRTLMGAYKRRSWGVGANPINLNVEELASLWHFPAISIKAPLIKKAEARRGEPPVGLPVTFLENTLAGNPEPDLQAGIFETASSSLEPAPVKEKRTAEEVIASAEVPILTSPTLSISHSTPPKKETHVEAEEVEMMQEQDDSSVPPNLPV